MKISKNEKIEKINGIRGLLKFGTSYKEIKKIMKCGDNLIIFTKNLIKKEEENLLILGRILGKNIQIGTINPEIFEDKEIQNVVKKAVFELGNAQL